jgi:hypothetical protein
MIKLILPVALLLFATPPALATTDRPLARVDDHGRQAVRRPPPAAQPAAAPAPAAERGADGWVSIGPYGGIVSALAASPSVGGLVLVALDSPGGNSLYRSTDGGQSWQPVAALGGLGVQAIAFAADGTAYLATGFHLRASTDGGLNWTTVTNPFSSSISEVAIDPGTGDLWLGIGSALGGSTFVIQSTDGGATWTDRSPPLASPRDTTALAFAPGAPLTVYAGFSGFPGGGGLWVSGDGGASWNDRSAGLPAVPVNDLVWDGARAIVAGGAEFGSQTFGLYASDDGGVTWTPLHDGTWPSLYTFGLDLDPNDPAVLLVATAQAGVFRSPDGGASWSFGVAGTAGSTFNTVRFAPGSSTAAFAGAGSRGVFRSGDGGLSFAESSDGLNGVEVTSVAVHPADPLALAAAFSGMNDGGVQTSVDGGVTWDTEPVPPTRYSRVEYAPGGTLYAISDGPSSVAPEGVYRREGNGSWTSLGPDQGGLFETEGAALRFSAHDPGLILLTGSDFGVAGFEATVWRSLTAGASWSKVYESAGSGAVPAVEIVADGTDQRMVAGLQNFATGGGALRSVDGGGFWSESSSGLPADIQATDLCASPADPLRLFLATGFAPTGLYATADGGASWGSAGPLADDLRGVACDGDFDGVLYAGRSSSSGLLRSPDSGATWQPFDDGLGAGAFRHLVWTPDPAHLYLATTSGTWRRQLAALFTDGFESGDLSAWSASVGGP